MELLLLLFACVLLGFLLGLFAKSIKTFNPKDLKTEIYLSKNKEIKVLGEYLGYLYFYCNYKLNNIDFKEKGLSESLREDVTIIVDHKNKTITIKENNNEDGIN